MTPQHPPPPRSRQSRSAPATARFANLLLAALDRDDIRRLESELEIVPLPVKKFLHRPGDLISHVYFPGGGFCSELTVLESGEMVEIATIGREGMVGVFAAEDGNGALSAAMVQAEIERCYRLPARVFRREMDRGGGFSRLITQYAHAHIAFIMQSTACNAVHTVERRLARWLLMAHDRVGRDEFPLTQEFVSMMLGVARPTVTIVAGTLQKAGLIAYRRGSITILDRENLEAASCECYRVGTNLLLAVTGNRRDPPNQGKGP
jgi:CRP-like cAMP-binding protein